MSWRATEVHPQGHKANRWAHLVQTQHLVDKHGDRASNGLTMFNRALTGTDSIFSYIS